MQQALPPKQARFVLEYVKDLNATQAAIRAGYAKASAEVQGCRLLRNAQIRAAVAKAQDRIAEKAGVTVDSIVGELEEARALALQERQASAAVAASLGKAKLSGLIVERHKHTGAIGTYDLTKLTDHELDRLEAILGPLAIAGADSGRESTPGD
jgi:phage terminase small subunit